MLQREQPAVGIEADSDGVEADLRRAWPLEQALSEPLACDRAHLTLLARADRGEWAERARRAGHAAHNARLHLAKHEKALIARHQIQLTEARPEVARDHIAPARLQMLRGKPLTLRSQPAPWVIHHPIDARPLRRTGGLRA